jgi:hypothetical protein
MIEEVSVRGHSKAHNLQGSSRALLGRQLEGAEVAEASEEDMGISPRKSIACSVVKTRVTLQERAKLLFKRKKRLLKQKLGRTSRSRCYSPYIPEYTGNQPAAFVASASHSQASWPQLPLPPPLPPAHTQSQQPEGR